MADFRAGPRYAKSLIELAQEQNQLDRINTDMMSLRDAVAHNRSLRTMLSSPVVPVELKEKVLTQIFSPSFASLTMDFLRIILRKRREGYIPQMAEAFTVQYNQIRGIARAELITPTPATAELKHDITAKLAKELNLTIDLKEIVDPSLVGGFVLRVGDRQIDASVASQLRNMRKELISTTHVPALASLSGNSRN